METIEEPTAEDQVPVEPNRFSAFELEPGSARCKPPTVSGNGDQGADPNKLVAITDTLGATVLPPAESFTTIHSAGFGEVIRGVSFTPGSM
jgi:hypothetical protein